MTKIGDYEVHEDAGKWDMGEEEYAAFAADIKKNGLLEPIWLRDGQILDGRHRMRACLEAGIEPRFRPYEGKSPRQFSWSQNAQRRHWSTGARAVYTIDHGRWLKGENQHTRGGACTDPPISLQEAAEIAGVSPTTVGYMRAVVDKGEPEILAAVKDETISIRAAAELARKPKEEQRAAIERGFKPDPKQENSRSPSPTKPSKIADSDAARRFSVVISDAVKAAGGSFKHVNSTMGTVQFQSTHEGHVYMVTIESVGS